MKLPTKIREAFARSGKVGGGAKSPAKADACRRNLERARAALAVIRDNSTLSAHPNFLQAVKRQTDKRK